MGCTQSPAGPYNIGTTTVTLTCTDRKSHSASCTGVVTVTDKVPPTLTLTAPANQSVECTKNGSYSDPGDSASDLCDGPLPQSSITVTGTVNMEVPGTYSLSYSGHGSGRETVSRPHALGDGGRHAGADHHPHRLGCDEGVRHATSIRAPRPPTSATAPSPTRS